MSYRFSSFRSNSCVFLAFIHFLSLYFPLPFQGNCDSTEYIYIHKTFNPTALNTSDIKSYSIVGTKDSERKRRLIIPYNSSRTKRKSGLKVKRMRTAEIYIRLNDRIAVELENFFFVHLLVVRH